MVEQTINISALLEYIGFLVMLVLASILITRAIRNGYINYINTKLDVVNMEIKTIKENREKDKAQNDKEHDRLTLLFDKIDEKLDRIIEKKSA